MQPTPWLGGLVIEAAVSASWYLTGAIGHLAQDPQTLEPAWLGTHSRRPETLSFVAPTAHFLALLTPWSGSSNHLSFGVSMMLGMAAGGVATVPWRHEFRLELFRDASDLGRHALGAALMGVGGTTALGCSMGQQGVSGLPALSAASLAAATGIGVGVVVAPRCLAWRVESKD